jgi:hypothetical protein
MEKTALVADCTVTFERIDLGRGVDLESHAAAVATTRMFDQGIPHR